jgi:hypothetical protein
VTNGSNLSEITALPLRALVAFALGVAEMVVEELTDEPQGFARGSSGLGWLAKPFPIGGLSPPVLCQLAGARRDEPGTELLLDTHH